MKTLSYTIAVGLVAGLCACSDTSGSSSSQASRPAAAVPPAMAPDMVRQVQSKLRDGGYYKQGSVDGVWGSGTETAVRSFQHDHNLGSSGQLDVPTLQALNLTSAPYNANRNAPLGQPSVTQPSVTQPLATQPTGVSPNSAPADTTTAPGTAVPGTTAPAAR